MARISRLQQLDLPDTAALDELFTPVVGLSAFVPELEVDDRALATRLSPRISNAFTVSVGIVCAGAGPEDIRLHAPSGIDPTSIGRNQRREFSIGLLPVLNVVCQP